MEGVLRAIAIKSLCKGSAMAFLRVCVLKVIPVWISLCLRSRTEPIKYRVQVDLRSAPMPLGAGPVDDMNFPKDVQDEANMYFEQVTHL